MMEKLLTDRTSQNNRPFCSNCQKPGHFVGNCFALRKCFNYDEKGHIATNCKKAHSAPATVNLLEGFTKEHCEPEQPTLINVCVSDKPVSFLYDTGSQYTIITRKTYDSLPNKPPLSSFNSSGIGVDGHTFCFDGLVYLNLKEGGTRQVKYESVSVSKEINSNIFGAKTENRFKRCQRDFEKIFIEYKTDKNQTVFTKCYKEKSLFTAAFIEVAKASFVPVQSTKFVKVKSSQMFDKAWFPHMRLIYSHKSNSISLMRLYFTGLKFLISYVPTKFHKYHIFE